MYQKVNEEEEEEEEQDQQLLLYDGDNRNHLLVEERVPADVPQKLQRHYVSAPSCIQFFSKLINKNKKKENEEEGISIEEQENRIASVENPWALDFKLVKSFFFSNLFLTNLLKICQKLEVDPNHGLTNEQVDRHKSIYGINKLKQKKPKPFWRVLLNEIRLNLFFFRKI